MPVCNAAPFLAESIASILGQTFADFELVILENGSCDGSRTIAREWSARDEHIRLLEHDRVLGMAGSSNQVVAAARAPLIARMDADDVSGPRRLELQAAVLRRRPDAVAVGTLYDGIDMRSRRVRPRDRSLLTRRTTEMPFPHGSVMFRWEAFDAVGGYREECSGWEDLDLLQRLAAVGPVLVLPDSLYRVRFHARSSTAQMDLEQMRRISTHKRRVVDARYPDADATAFHSDESFAGQVYLREAMRLWAGAPPAFRDELRARGVDASRRRRLPLFVWSRWSQVSPGTLRAALRLWIRLRDARAARRLPDGRAVEWRFG